MDPNVALTGHPNQGPQKFMQITSTDGLVQAKFYWIEAVGATDPGTLTTITGRGGDDISAHNTSGNYHVGVGYPVEGTSIEVATGEFIIYLSGR
jgi:hypothetical protein